MSIVWGMYANAQPNFVWQRARPEGLWGVVVHGIIVIILDVVLSRSKKVVVKGEKFE